MTSCDEPELEKPRERFLSLVKELRPDLHRYCARMTGSVIDGEDIVQDVLARAYHELTELKEMPALRSWLFRIAHNRAIDFLRGRAQRATEPLEEAAEVSADHELEPNNVAAREEAVRSAVSRFLELAPIQRSCVILKDVFDYSIREIGDMLGLSVPSIKAALARGRERLRKAPSRDERDPGPASVSPMLTRYANLFNRRDWDSLRAMLLDDVRLEVASRIKRQGRADVGEYFSNYDGIAGWRVVPGKLDGQEVLAVFVSPSDQRPRYFVQLVFAAGKIVSIKDFRHVPYIARDADIRLCETPNVSQRES